MSNDQAGVRRLDVNEYVMPPQQGVPPQPMMRPAPAGYGEPGVPYSPPPNMQAIAAPRAPTHFDPPPYAVAPPAAPPPPAPATSPAAVQAAQGQPAAASADDGAVTLTREYEGYDGVRIRTVRFRKPGTKDLRKYGYPVRATASGAIEELPEVVARYMMALSEPALPPTVIDSMDLDDFQKCSGPIVRFFLG